MTVLLSFFFFMSACHSPFEDSGWVSSKKGLGPMGWLLQAWGRRDPWRVAIAQSLVEMGQRHFQHVHGGKKTGEETRM